MHNTYLISITSYMTSEDIIIS